MHTFKHPKYYKELRRRNKETQQEPQRILDKPGRSVSNSDQVISLRAHDGERERAPGPGHKHQASSTQAASFKQTRTSSGSAGFKRQATSIPTRVTSVKHQATSSKLLDS
jgi:hypothetical protein